MDTVLVLRASAFVLVVFVTACIGQTATPTPSPAVSATAAPTASAAPSASAAARRVRPFDRVLAIAGPADAAGVAVDRDRVAFVEGTSVTVVEAATGQKRDVHQATIGWSVFLSPRGLRGDVLVLTETRTDGQRTDGRAIRIDLRANTRVTLDEWSGPYLGGGDTLRAEPPITNGTDVVWTRITPDLAPFAVEIVLARGAGAPRVIAANQSAVWADLHDDGRIAVSTFIIRGDQADLVLWQDGQVTRVGTRGIPDGGPARFVGDRLFWAIGPDFVSRIERGQLIATGGQAQGIDFSGCSWTGATARQLAIACEPAAGGTSTQSLVDPVTGARDAIPGFNLIAGPRAAVWREATQWWLGILPP